MKEKAVCKRGQDVRAAEKGKDDYSGRKSSASPSSQTDQTVRTVEQHERTKGGKKESKETKYLL